MLGHVATQKSPAMQIPMTYPYAAIPVGASFMVMNSIAVLIEYYTVKEEEK
jgi:TRAP-type C4-dicarboxylate transport system permease small subunit